MPYIDDAAKARLADGQRPKCAGELTYCFQQSIQEFLEERYGIDGSMKYFQLATVLGALEGAKLDFIKRVIHPYEKAKEQENGDVWSEELIAVARGGKDYVTKEQMTERLEMAMGRLRAQAGPIRPQRLDHLVDGILEDRRQTDQTADQADADGMQLTGDEARNQLHRSVELYERDLSRKQEELDDLRARLQRVQARLVELEA